MVSVLLHITAVTGAFMMNTMLGNILFARTNDEAVASYLVYQVFTM